MDLSINPHNFYPWVTFLAGLTGSVHCLGMCGGLVTASCTQKQDIKKYQVGRLIGYLFLGVVAGMIGSFFKIDIITPEITLLFGILLGVLFCYWGIQSWLGKNSEPKMPSFMGKTYSYLWKKIIYKNEHFSKAFFTGLISILLPCGLLYGIIFGAMALQNPFWGFVSMFSFWLGTLPAMLLAPTMLQKIMVPLKTNLPRTYALSLIFLGVLTISLRVGNFQEARAQQEGPETEQSIQMCH